jgi:hypothetical protein
MWAMSYSRAAFFVMPVFSNSMYTTEVKRVMEHFEQKQMVKRVWRDAGVEEKPMRPGASPPQHLVVLVAKAK